MKRTPIIIANWKMHKTISEAMRFIHTLAPKVKKVSCRVMIAPPYTAIASCVEAAKGTKIEIGAQNMHDEDEGAFTGEISAPLIVEAGASFVILGHSERRQIFHETDEWVNHKLKQAIQNKLTPVLCIGETQEEHQKGKTKEILSHQIDRALEGCSAEELKNLILAYEPVWAIGTGKTATPEMAEETHQMIRKHISKKWGNILAENLPLLYGGSVKLNNIADLINQPDIDGALIGGASLDEEIFAQMVLQGSKR